MNEPTAHLHVHLPRWFLLTVAVSVAGVALAALLVADSVNAHLTDPRPGPPPSVTPAP